jgi:putative flippase GtrA
MVATALRFGVVGVAGAAVNMIALHVLYAMAHLPLLVASTLAVETAIAHNYLLNDRWTFRAKGASLARFAKFNASTLVTLLVNVGVVWVLVGSAGIDYLAANLVGIAVGAALNFGASSTWVWRGAST